MSSIIPGLAERESIRRPRWAPACKWRAAGVPYRRRVNLVRHSEGLENLSFSSHGDLANESLTSDCRQLTRESSSRLLTSLGSSR